MNTRSKGQRGALLSASVPYLPPAPTTYPSASSKLKAASVICCLVAATRVPSYAMANSEDCLCFICENTLSEGKTIVVKQKGLDTFRECSRIESAFSESSVCYCA